MDSGNSGSMQSSSGGDEEYDSRPESIPSFLNPPPPTHFGASDSNPEPSLLSHFQNHQSAGFFDISSNYFQALSQSQQPNSNPNFLFNLDTVRSRPQRSDPSSCTELGNLAAGGASPSSTLSMLASQGPGPGLGTGLGSGPGPGPTVIQLRSINNEATTGPPRGPAPQTTTTNNNNNNNAGGRNSKKRTRASRRAPTTVLTTDTSNFRAMVQEFTGIPAPPFSGSSYSRRFDLFGTAGGGGGGSAMRSGNMDTLGPLYPLRPSPQKVHQQSPFLSSSSSSSPLLNNNSMIEATNVATTSNNNFLSSDHHHHQGLPKHHHHHHHHQHHVMNMQNPINLLPFQSLPQPNHNPLHTSLNVPGFGTRPPQGSLSMASLDELDMSGGSRGYINTTNNRVVDADHGRHELFRALDGNSPRVSNNSSCKLNYTAASSSEFHLEKGLEMNVSTRGEGTVDSWICPSD